LEGQGNHSADDEDGDNEASRPDGARRERDKIMLFTLPFLVVGLILNVAYPSLFDVGGPPSALRVVSVAVLVAGVAIWAWSLILILTRVPRGELITSGLIRLQP
jgi:hypothetical protein